MVSILGPVVWLAGLASVLVVQPLVLQLSCALVGVKVPRFVAALLSVAAVVVAAVLVGAVWSVTGGLILGQISAWLGAASGLVVSALTASIVYSASLRVSMGKAFGVAVVSHLLSSAMFAVLWAGARWVSLLA